MSGGVDSSVAAALLIEQGFDVVGITIKTYDYDEVGGNAAEDSSCCSLDGINDARSVCLQLGIPHYVLDFSAQFRSHVIQPFIDEYLRGRTPNPCVLCNRSIKWEEMIRRALELEADFVAMGHYAKLAHDETRRRWWVQRGRDRSKDQSYALWTISQESLHRTIFPLGDLTKEEVREHARRFGLSIAGKQESFEICFIPDNNYGRFLKESVPNLASDVANGDIVFEDRVVGSHAGYPFYTIGQRRGLNMALGEPVFVARIDAEKNRIHLGREEDLYHRSFTVRSVNLMKYSQIDAPMRVIAKVRYKDEGAPAIVTPLDGDALRVTFDEPRRAITPGQSTVWYDGDDVVGGGIIDSVSHD